MFIVTDYAALNASRSFDLTEATSANLSDHGPAIVQHLVLYVCLGQWPSFTGMEHGTLHTSAVHMAICLVREMVDVRTGSSSLNFFQAVFT